jgi:hypothetical protein
MKGQKTSAIVISAMVLLVAGCDKQPVLTHKLVVTGGEHSIPLYPDEATYVKVSHKAQQGGVNGMIGNAQQDLRPRRLMIRLQLKSFRVTVWAPKWS